MRIFVSSNREDWFSLRWTLCGQYSKTVANTCNENAFPLPISITIKMFRIHRRITDRQNALSIYQDHFRIHLIRKYFHSSTLKAASQVKPSTWIPISSQPNPNPKRTSWILPAGPTQAQETKCNPIDSRSFKGQLRPREIKASTCYLRSYTRQ